MIQTTRIHHSLCLIPSMRMYTNDETGVLCVLHDYITEMISSFANLYVGVNLMVSNVMQYPNYVNVL